MKYVFLIFLFVLIFQACRDGQTSVFCGEYVIVNDFPIIQTPQSEKLDIEIMGLNQLYVVDTFLIAFKASGHNDFFEIYSTKVAIIGEIWKSRAKLLRNRLFEKIASVTG